ncbi:MAG: glycosyltransferase family 9 protein [Elusimicrobiota bacterium]|nr:hypothetical protein [Endomicrobiia bacterium]MDW8166786.1 glycosyltransferase family 9 protein [Elusimicrobiota bacterium]
MNLHRIIDITVGENAIVSAGKIPLKYIASLIKKCNVLVTGDTGIMHVVIAVDIIF